MLVSDLLVLPLPVTLVKDKIGAILQEYFVSGSLEVWCVWCVDEDACGVWCVVCGVWRRIGAILQECFVSGWLEANILEQYLYLSIYLSIYSCSRTTYSLQGLYIVDILER